MKKYYYGVIKKGSDVIDIVAASSQENLDRWLEVDFNPICRCRRYQWDETKVLHCLGGKNLHKDFSFLRQAADEALKEEDKNFGGVSRQGKFVFFCDFFLRKKLLAEAI